MKAFELIEELQKWPDLPVYFAYTLSEKAMTTSEGKTMVAEIVSEVSVKMVLKGLVSDGGLITAVVMSGPKVDWENNKVLQPND